MSIAFACDPAGTQAAGAPAILLQVGQRAATRCTAVVANAASDQECVK